MQTIVRPDFDISRLSKGQVDCLILVSQNLTSKEIAPMLGISRHTVDQRIRLAMHALEVPRRVDAARVVSARLSGTPSSSCAWHDELVEPVLDGLGNVLPLPLPVATKSNPTNRLTVVQRLIWILVIGAAAATSMGFYLAGLASLDRMMRGEP